MYKAPITPQGNFHPKNHENEIELGSCDLHDVATGTTANAEVDGRAEGQPQLKRVRYGEETGSEPKASGSAPKRLMNFSGAQPKTR